MFITSAAIGNKTVLADDTSSGKILIYKFPSNQTIHGLILILLSALWAQSNKETISSINPRPYLNYLQ